jgi:uncharacterized damage-inducible protein DinB
MEMDHVLHDLARHNAWATTQVLEFCRGLDEPALHATAPGTFGTAIATLRHLIDSEAGYLFRLTGAWTAYPWTRDEAVGHATMAERAAVLAVTWEQFIAGEEDIELDGHHFKVLGDHEADLRQLLASLRALTADGIARAHLEQTSGRLLMAGDELEGRLVWDGDGDSGTPYAVVVDGRRLSWEEFGRTLEPFEGWRFRIAMLEIEQLAPAPADTPRWQDLE